MGGFIKVTEKKSELSGYQKTAILLGELGNTNSAEILKQLSLKPSQMKKIRIAMKKLGTFSHSDAVQVSNEIQVLNETTNYGIAKGILSTSKGSDSYMKDFVNSRKKEIQTYDSESVAKVLKNWLGD